MKSTALYSTKQSISSVMMILALIWLTISLPYVYAAQQQLAKQKIASAASAKSTDEGDNTNNPFANTTEEKAPGNSTISEEYLHHYEEPIHFSPDKISHAHHHSYDVYVAFHGELLSPPPESFLI